MTERTITQLCQPWWSKYLYEIFRTDWQCYWDHAVRLPDGSILHGAWTLVQGLLCLTLVVVVALVTHVM